VKDKSSKEESGRAFGNGKVRGKTGSFSKLRGTRRVVRVISHTKRINPGRHLVPWKWGKRKKAGSTSEVSGGLEALARRREEKYCNVTKGKQALCSKGMAK